MRTVGKNTTRRSGRVVIKTQEFMIDDIRVVLSTKHVKNINMRVKAPDGHLAVSAPPWVDRSVVEDFARQKMDWIRDKRHTIQLSPRVDRARMSEGELKKRKAAMKVKVIPLIAQWEQIMEVTSHTLALRDMSSRWGSCNPTTGRICLNVQLLDYPDECLEYVVVHELAHLIERGHGPRFKAVMDKYLPDWRERKARLR